MASGKYYAVFKGRKTGIFTSWQQCEAQIKGFSGASFKSFKTRSEAETAFQQEHQQVISIVEGSRDVSAVRRSIDEIIPDSICVDASCLGNPGPVEYQGVHTTTGEAVFHTGPIANGTNNLGEFLAIVHALAHLKQQGKNTPIYSDSSTAMLWVKNKQVRTKLEQNKKTEEVFDLLKRALDWLQTNDYTNPILKWNTAVWGEIPADFGRK